MAEKGDEVHFRLIACAVLVTQGDVLGKGTAGSSQLVRIAQAFKVSALLEGPLQLSIRAAIWYPQASWQSHSILYYVA